MIPIVGLYSATVSVTSAALADDHEGSPHEWVRKVGPQRRVEQSEHQRDSFGSGTVLGFEIRGTASAA